MGAGLRPKAKGLDKPPDPTVRAPVLDPTGEGRLEKEPLATSLAAYSTTGCGGMRADSADIGPEGIPVGASVSSDRSAQHDSRFG